MGMQDNRVTALLVAANVLCFGMQQISTTFTSYCVRVSTSFPTVLEGSGQRDGLCAPLVVQH